MVDALCGGGDTAEGMTYTSFPLSSAAIVTGDVRFVSCLSYESTRLEG